MTANPPSASSHRPGRAVVEPIGSPSVVSANPVQEAYDANAELYASLFGGQLDRDGQSARWLSALADQARTRRGPVVDLGCGPGSVVDHLSRLGLTATGIDLSPGQIAQAQLAFPDLQFAVGDLKVLPFGDATVGGIVSKHSIIHSPPGELGHIFVEWFRVLEPAAPVFTSFFGSQSAEAHGTPFDHKVTTAYELFPATIADELKQAGFTDARIETTPPHEDGRPFDHAILLTAKPA